MTTGPLLRSIAGVLAMAAIVAACTSGDTADNTDSVRGPVPSNAVGDSEPETGTSDCRRDQRPVEPEGPAGEVSVLRRGDDESAAVEAVVYPRPDYEGDAWSQWGQGLALEDGRFLSAIGDELAPDGNSYLFVYDPDSGRLIRFTDVASLVEHADGEWGYGKIHGQIVPGRCGEAFVSTYWGTDEDIEYRGNYRGDVLFRLDTTTLELEPLGVPLPEHGLPSLAGFAPEDLVYGEAVVPTPDDALGSKDGAFFAYDVTTGEVAFRTDDERLNGFRNVLVNADGTAYLAADNSRLLVYEPGATELRMHPEQLPGGFLRASTSPAPDGTVYGATQNPDRLFALRPDGGIDDLGAARGYTASVALHPDGDRFFYVPDAQGTSWKQGTPLVAVDTETGEQTTVVELNELAEKELGLTLAGSYDVAVDPSGERVYVGLNAGPDRDEPWGEVVLVIVQLR